MSQTTRILAQNIWTDGSLGLKSNATNPIKQDPSILVYSNQEQGIVIEGVTHPFDIAIYNTLGQCLYQGKRIKTGSQITKIETPHFNPGIYVVKILQEGGKLTCSKFFLK